MQWPLFFPFTETISKFQNWCRDWAMEQEPIFSTKKGWKVSWYQLSYKFWRMRIGMKNYKIRQDLDAIKWNLAQWLNYLVTWTLELGWNFWSRTTLFFAYWCLKKQVWEIKWLFTRKIAVSTWIAVGNTHIMSMAISYHGFRCREMQVTFREVSWALNNYEFL